MLPTGDARQLYLHDMGPSEILRWRSFSSGASVAGLYQQRAKKEKAELKTVKGKSDVTFTRCRSFLTDETGQAVREAAMKLNMVKAVLKAAEEWVSAEEALVAAQQNSEDTEAEQEAVDVASSRLVVAVTRSRSERALADGLPA
jgi:hypothetical protein